MKILMELSEEPKIASKLETRTNSPPNPIPKMILEVAKRVRFVRKKDTQGNSWL